MGFPLLNKKIIIRTILFFILIISNTVWATDYYFHPNVGDDTNKGTLLKPFKTLDKASELKLFPGDVLWLAADSVFFGQLVLDGIRGSDSKPIEIRSYSYNKAVNNSAIIDAKGFSNGISLTNCSNIHVKDLNIRANGGRNAVDAKMRNGILVITSKVGFYENIKIENVTIKDIFYENYGFERAVEEVKTANGTQPYGWGIRFINKTAEAKIRDISIIGCVIENIAHTGIKFTGSNHNIQNILIEDNQVLFTGGPGIQMSGVQFAKVKNNYVKNSGSNNDTRKWGRGSGLWTWGSSFITIENNSFLNANGPGDSAGCHIDFNCDNVVVQYNFSANNAGGFCEILGNNYNCAYRYNISVNDGHRVKGENNAFQEGKTLWLSGFSGKETKRKGPYNSYFYNNTIYVKKGIVSKIAVDRVANGVLIANNIFYIEGESKLVKGDQYTPENDGDWKVVDVFFSNNLFLKASNWPKPFRLQDKNPLYGDPKFIKSGGMNIVDYIPLNVELIKDRGVKIHKLSNDPVGLGIGLHPHVDILGNPIKGLPDMGAIELD